MLEFVNMLTEPFVWADWLFNSPATPHARIFRNVIQATSRGNKIGTSTVRKIKAYPFTMKYSRPFFTSFRGKRAISATYVFFSVASKEIRILELEQYCSRFTENVTISSQNSDSFLLVFQTSGISLSTIF